MFIDPIACWPGPRRCSELSAEPGWPAALYKVGLTDAPEFSPLGVCPPHPRGAWEALELSPPLIEARQPLPRRMSPVTSSSFAFLQIHFWACSLPSSAANVSSHRYKAFYPVPPRHASPEPGSICQLQSVAVLPSLSEPPLLGTRISVPAKGLLGFPLPSEPCQS